MLISRKVKAHEQERFIAFNQRNSGAEVTTAYLDKAQARVFVRPHDPDRWIATYVVNTQPPYRCLSVLDDQHRNELLAANSLLADAFAEITLLSRDRTIHWNPIERSQYYVMGAWDALRTGRPYLLGGTTNAQLLIGQMALLDQILYEGELNLFGQKKHGWLLYVSRNRAMYNLARHLAEQLWKAIRPQTAPSAAQPSA